MKILIIEDDQATRETLSLAFEFRWPDANLLFATEGTKAIELVEQESPDIVILDLGLPDIDGIAVLQEIRLFSNVPIIILTARTDQIVVIKGLELGADDYITKPFDPMVLLAHVKSVLRRSHGLGTKEYDEGHVVCGDLVIDFTARQVTRGGKPVKLTPTEWNLLYCLVRNAGMVVPYQILSEKVWGSDYIVEDISALRTCVWRLRTKLGDDAASPNMIVGERSVGYRFMMPK